MEEHHTSVYLSAEKGSAGKEGDTAQRLLPSAGGTQGKCSRCYICQQFPLSPVECQLGHRKPFSLQERVPGTALTLPAEEVAQLWQPRQGTGHAEPSLKQYPDDFTAERQSGAG